MLGVGVWDALSARLAERAGFEILFVSGYAVSATLIGEPDFGLLTASEVLETARRAVRTVRRPVIVDGDTGHGGPLNVQRMVRELHGAEAGPEGQDAKPAEFREQKDSLRMSPQRRRVRRREKFCPIGRRRLGKTPSFQKRYVLVSLCVLGPARG